MSTQYHSGSVINIFRPLGSHMYDSLLEADYKSDSLGPDSGLQMMEDNKDGQACQAFPG